ncbi:MAG: hypothetical protein ACU0FH_16815 [Heliomarina sp.]|uniref:hypothetical protein n=1 Tax=Heliomarina sp. TaxID=2917556 RepID=UPI004059998D
MTNVMGTVGGVEITDNSARILEIYNQLDDVGQLIMHAYVKKLNEHEGPIDDVHNWAKDIMSRYRNGDEIYASDLEI